MILKSFDANYITLAWMVPYFIAKIREGLVFTQYTCFIPQIVCKNIGNIKNNIKTYILRG